MYTVSYSLMYINVKGCPLGKLFLTIEIRHMYFWKVGGSYLHIYTIDFNKRADSNVCLEIQLDFEGQLWGA